ncbi:hypothetical protein T281_04395 [Rhodomicrobium udaipurense JA643]|uniref:HEAT repeat domain-containing protein n=1 Tax=Rhodomicrobium udaipurense TaxID=1202716 RepID=A0A8I1GHG2_9HYPH|nr:hypothetical protein [Rhodomicrobium udaipurense]KAI95646.1 hypothetical protein T281_04395 [Rhodomicrobium udaipurense JA643]MBJ7543082.1 hypothetical protein [Rhodomicrobium udaipurense]
MRRFLIPFLILALLLPASAAPPPATANWPEAGQRWIKKYRAKHEPLAVPAVIQMLSHSGALKEPDSSGLYVGFLAGVLNANPKKAQAIIEKTLPLPFEDQWIVIRAVAYSQIPDWRNHMSVLAARLPDRRVMAERYLSGELPTLNQIALEPYKAGTVEKVQSFFNGDMFFKDKDKEKEERKRQITFASNAELIDTLWGIYFATGREGPIAQIVTLLPWSKERDSVDKLTIGSMARFTLASNAARDADLLRVLKNLQERQPKKVKPILAEVIEAAELADTARLGKDALAALDELKRKGPGSTRDLLTWGSVGQAAVSAGCLGLAVASVGTAGIPCVVGGALSTGALRYIGSSGGVE